MTDWHFAGDDDILNELAGLGEIQNPAPAPAPPPQRPSDEELARKEREGWNLNDLDSKFIEWVPTSYLLPMHEWDRTPGNRNEHGLIGYRDPAQYEALTNHILTNGFKAPVWVDFNPDTGMAHLSEGNHRVTIARDNNIPALPVRVYRSGRVPQDKSILRPHTYQGTSRWVGQYLKPSEIGIPTTEPWTPQSFQNQAKMATPEWDFEGRVAAGGGASRRVSSDLHRLEWQPGGEGKGFALADGGVWTWNIDANDPKRRPWHMEKSKEIKAEGRSTRAAFYITPDGQIWTLPGRKVDPESRAAIETADQRLYFDQPRVQPEQGFGGDDFTLSRSKARSPYVRVLPASRHSWRPATA